MPAQSSVLEGVTVPAHLHEPGVQVRAAAPTSAFGLVMGSSNDDARAPSLYALRSEVQNLMTILTSVRQGDADLKTYASYITQTVTDITKIMTHPALTNHNDAIQNLHNLWQQMQVNPLLIDPAAEVDPQMQLHLLTLLASQIQRIVFIIGTLTIPARVNQWIKEARPGYYIPFHEVFDDELPGIEERQKVLNYLAWSPNVLKNGLVDAANGLIYRYAADKNERVKSFWWLIGALLASLVLIVVICYLPIQATTWTLSPSHVPMFVVGWIAVLSGIVVHIAVANVKRSQVLGGHPPMIAVGDLSFWVNTRIGQILFKLLLALIGLFAVAFASGANNVTLLNTFLVGYSLDSFIEIFGNSIEQQSTKQLASLKQQWQSTIK